jgi:hypothetical protein
MMRPFKPNDARTLAGAGGVAFTMLAAMLFVVVAATMALAPQESAAKAAYAQSTGRPCTACHTTPPKLNACGKKYAANKSTKC